MGDGSLGYAERLSYRAELGGTLGEPEIAEANDTVAKKATSLAKMIAAAEHIVAFTGAGISTACGIPGACARNIYARKPAVSPHASVRSLPRRLSWAEWRVDEAAAR